MAYHSLIVAMNSIALRRSNNKSYTNPRILEDFVIFCVWDHGSLEVHIKTKLVKAIYMVIHRYRYSNYKAAWLLVSRITAVRSYSLETEQKKVQAR
jgi:hypothetical protein